jgi:hypothetical protein
MWKDKELNDWIAGESESEVAVYMYVEEEVEAAQNDKPVNASDWLG